MLQCCCLGRAVMRFDQLATIRDCNCIAMRNSSPEQIIRAVRDQYETFPYPPIRGLEQEDPSRDLLPSFNVDFELPEHRCLKDGAKIWVPGCGTRWAAMIALQFRNANIVASDLSEANLAIHQRISQLLDLHNIEFRHEDILKTSYVEKFDFISCVGVLHHLPNPNDGFAILSHALKPEGIAEIMIYDRMNRRYSIRMREIIATFDPDERLSAEARFALALKVLRALNQHASAPRELKRILGYLDSDPNFESQLADSISHPQEHYFDVPSLLHSLRKVGLKPRTWRPPHRFRPKFMLTDNELWRLVDEMNAERAAHLGHLLSAGLLEVFVERMDRPTDSPLPSVSTRRVRAMATGLLHQLSDGNEPPVVEPLKKVYRSEDGLWFDGGQRRPAVAAYGADIDCIRPGRRNLSKLSDFGFETMLDAEDIETILHLAADPITIGEIAATLANGQKSRAEIESVCDQLCRTPFRVLATV